MIECLESHARGHRPITIYGHYTPIDPLALRGDGHAERRTYGSSRVPNPEGIERAFCAFRKRREATVLTHASHSLAPPGKYLVGVALMAHVPYQTILGGVENIMKRDG